MIRGGGGASVGRVVSDQIRKIVKEVKAVKERSLNLVANEAREEQPQEAAEEARKMKKRPMTAR